MSRSTAEIADELINEGVDFINSNPTKDPVAIEIAKRYRELGSYTYEIALDNDTYLEKSSEDVDLSSLSDKDLLDKYGVMTLKRATDFANEKVKEITDTFAAEKKTLMDELSAKETELKAKLDKAEDNVRVANDVHKTLQSDHDDLKEAFDLKARHVGALEAWIRKVMPLCKKNKIPTPEIPNPAEIAKKVAKPSAPAIPNGTTSTTPTTDASVPPAPSTAPPAATEPTDEEILKIDTATASPEDLIKYFVARKKKSLRGGQFILEKFIPDEIKEDADEIRKVLKKFHY